jgi:hypothetical protein
MLQFLLVKLYLISFKWLPLFCLFGVVLHYTSQGLQEYILGLLPVVITNFNNKEKLHPYFVTGFYRGNLIYNLDS